MNPAVCSNPDSPIYGRPILDADKAKSAILVRCGQGTGFSGIESRLFFLDNAPMLYLQGQTVGSDLSAAVKQL